MTKIILIRHCKTEGNDSGKMQGYHNDSPFTEEGIKQLENLKNRMADEKIDAIYCSDLGRAIRTAEELAKVHSLKVIPLEELREADIGDWRELPVKEAIQKWIEYYESEKNKGKPRENIRPPGGENAWDHQKRIFKAIRKIIAEYPDKTVIIVGHSGTNKVILGTCKGLDYDDFYSIPQDNAAISTIIANINYKVDNVNDTSHLE